MTRLMMDSEKCGRSGERGAALIIALLAALLLAVLGAGAAITSGTDIRLAANRRDIGEAFRAADAAMGRALADLKRQSDWNAVLAGAVRSSFADGAPSGLRTIAPGTTIVLDEIVNRADCGQPAVCSSTRMDAVTGDRPWGANNPRWQLFAWGPASALAGSRPGDRPYYVVVLVGDDQMETDGDPSRDGDDPELNPGAGVVVLRAYAFGAGGYQQIVEVTVARPDGERVADSSGGGGTGAETGSDGDGSVIPPATPYWPAGSVRLLSWRWIR